MKDLGGMNIIVTGGAGSIGHATACILYHPPLMLRATAPAVPAPRKQAH